jgi:TonB family protein
MRRRLLATIVLPAYVGVGMQATSVSPQYIVGDLPVPPAMAVSGGEVFLEVLVANDGRVDSIRTLRTTPPFTDAMVAAVRGWRFTPAESGGPVASRVLVAGMFTAPSLDGPTLGQPPLDIAVASDALPVPTTATSARYPPLAEGNGSVLVELTIDGSGRATDARAVVSSPAFDAAAIAAAKSWSFAASRNKRAVIRAYLLFGFRQPIVGR